jgi:hypothetical protein
MSRPRQKVCFQFQWWLVLQHKILSYILTTTLACRVARFFLVKYTKTGTIYQMTTKFNKMKFNIPNGLKENWPNILKIDQMGENIPNNHNLFEMDSTCDQMAIKYTNIFHCKTLQNLPKLVFLVWKKPSGNPARQCGLAFHTNSLFIHSHIVQQGCQIV